MRFTVILKALMKKLLAIVLFMLVSSLAVADGVNMVSGPTPTMNPTQQTKYNDIASRADGGIIDLRSFNAAAVDSGIINVYVFGLVGSPFRLVGAKTAETDAPNVDIWKGTGGGGKGLFLRSSAGGFTGVFWAEGKKFLIVPLDSTIAAVVQVDTLSSDVDE